MHGVEEGERLVLAELWRLHGGAQVPELEAVGLLELMEGEGICSGIERRSLMPGFDA